MTELWWHVYGTEMPVVFGEDDDGEPNEIGSWLTVTLGESTMHPEQLMRDVGPVLDPEIWNCSAPVRYLRSFDHEPTDYEKTLLEPEGFGED